MGMKRHAAAPRAALALGLLLMPPIAIAIDATADAVASLVSADIGHLGFISPALAQPGTLTKAQSDALAAYNNAVSNFKSILAQRRAQIDSKQPLPNLPGQALYLARNSMMSAYKDLTDALPSRIGGPNKLGIPPAYFDAGLEPLLDEYVKLFEIMQAPPANAQKFRYAIQGRRRSGNGHCASQRPWRGGCRSGRPHQPGAVFCRDQRQPEHRKRAFEQIQGKPASRHVRRSKWSKEVGGDKEVDSIP